MADISKIRVGGTLYDVKDATARAAQETTAGDVVELKSASQYDNIRHSESLQFALDSGYVTLYVEPLLYGIETKAYIGNSNNNIRLIRNASGITENFVVKKYKVTAGDKFVVGGRNVRLGGSYPIAAFFDDEYFNNGTLILMGSNSPTNYYTEFEVENDGYILVASLTQYGVAEIYKITQVTNKIHYEQPSITWSNGYWNANGELKQYGSYQVTNLIPVYEGLRIRATNLRGVGGSASAKTACLFDVFGNAVTTIATQNALDITIDSTLTADYKKIAFVSVGNDNGLSKAYITIDAWTPVYDLSGKNVYVLGDSISYLSGSWVFSLADSVNAKKVYNLARGGATWADRANMTIYDSSCPIWNNEFLYNTSVDGKTESYPANNDLSSAVPPVDNSNYTCISNEIRFMDRLITEWGRPNPDVIVIACGINDTRASTQQYSETAFNDIISVSIADMTDAQKKLLGGGIRYCIETIMTQYPHAQIIISTPIQCAYGYIRPYLPNTVDWLKAFHTFYATKLIDAYSESGISMAFEKGWDDMSYKRNNAGRYLYDGLHPNAEGKIVMANYFAREILYKAVSKY